VYTLKRLSSARLVTLKRAIPTAAVFSCSGLELKMAVGVKPNTRFKSAAVRRAGYLLALQIHHLFVDSPQQIEEEIF
jgi:hypothetical protein